MHPSLRTVCVFTVLLLCDFIITNGQAISMSPYSAYGIGLLHYRTTAQNRAMSGTGVGTRDYLNLNTLNPASYTSIRTPTQIFEIGFYLESDKYLSTSKSSTGSIGNLTSINYWFRFHKKWAGTVGLSPVSSVNYNITGYRNFIQGDPTPVNYKGSGGLSEFYFGNGFQLTDHFSIGAHLSYVFGAIEQTETIESGIGAGTGLSSSVHAHRLTGDFGAQYEFSLGDYNSITVGATYKPRFNLNTKKDIYAQEGYASDTLWTQSLKQDDYSIPSRYATGVSLRLKRMIYSLDASYAEWSQAQLDGNEKFRNTGRLSAGIQYAGDVMAEDYLKTVALRGGLYAEQNYIVINGSSFTYWGVNAGVAMPVFGQKGAINLTYSYNSTYGVPRGLIRQHANILTIELTFRDIWGVKRKFD